MNPNDLSNIRNWAVYNSTTKPADEVGLFGLKPENVEVKLVNWNTPAPMIQVSIAKPIRFYSPYLGGTFAARPAIASSPVESLGVTE